VSLSTLGLLAAATSWQWAVTGTAGLSALIFLLIAVLYADPPARVAADGGSGAGRLWRITPGEFVLAVAAGLIWMLANSGYIVFVGFAPAWLISGGVAAGTAGFLVSLSSWIMIGSVPLGGWIVDRAGHVNAFIGSGAVASAAAILLFSTGNALPVWTVGFGVLTGLWAAAIMTLPGQVLSPQGRATGFGVFYIVYYAGMAAAPALAGWLQDRSGDPRAALWLAALLVLLAAAALVPFRLLQRRFGRAVP
jgi:MFS family permease